MVDVKRIAAFFLIVIASLATIVWTTPDILKNQRLGLDLRGGFEILYVAKPIDEGGKVTTESLREAARSMERRIYSFGVSEPEVYPEGADRLRIRIAGVANQEEVRSILKKPAVLTFRSTEGCETPGEFCNIEMRGSDFVEGGAKVEYHPETGQPYVSIAVKDPNKFYEITSRLAKKGSPYEYNPDNVLAIYLDDELISAPGVKEPIPSGTAMISGNFTFAEAEGLKSIINMGALPVELEEVYVQSVGATLGKESLEKTVKAGIIGLSFILLFMLVVYRVPGMVSVVTLIIYTWLILLVMDWLHAVLTLPGIAALILGVGMAVDANIITFERIKEEIRTGKTILSAVRSGSRQSFRTITDANLTTIIAGVVLYYVGTGSIQGFALILILSILVSIITNVFLSRLLLILLVRSKLISKPGYFGVKEDEISEL